MTRGQQLAVSGTCLVAALAYAGAVTTWALGLFVLPGVVIAAAIAWPLVTHRMSGWALVAGGPLVLGWAELANIWTGQTNGPAARSTAVAAGCSLVAVVAAHSRWPALFLAPLAGTVAGALILGAGGEVPAVAVATAVCAALSLGTIERSLQRWTAPPRGRALLVLPLLIGLMAAGVVLLQAQNDAKSPTVLTAGREYPWIKPAWSDPLVSVSRSLRGAAPNSTHRRRRGTGPPATHPKPLTRAKHQGARASHAPPSNLRLYLLAAALLFVLFLALLVAARLLVVRLAWRRMRHRLAAGTPAEQVTGAWAWTRLRLEACRLPLATGVSPDVVAAGRAAGDLPAEVLTPLHALAAATTTAAFARAVVGGAEATAAWTVARQAEASARGRLTRGGRARLAFRTPAPRAAQR